MIPDLPNLADVTLPGRFKAPYTFKKEPFCDYARGGVALLDASQGLDVKDWRIDFEDGVATITSEGSPDFVVPDLPINLSWISFAFDQNMHYNVAYTVANKSFLWWYDTQAQRYLLTELGDVKTPFIRMDDTRRGSEWANTLVLSYLKNGNLYVRQQIDRFGAEYEIEQYAGNKLLQCGMTQQLRFQWKTTVVYPETLPCPQADMDLKPRERRYLSDIGDVRNMRMFQQEFQATHNKINFIFTEEEAAEFRDWYEKVLVHGGAWFYADWPLLHKDKEIAHRFVGQPKWEWVFGGNPGKLGRSKQGGGFAPPDDAVTVYKVSATVEVYDRKVENFYKSKIYHLQISEDISVSVAKFRGRLSPYYNLYNDSAILTIPKFSASITEWIYSDYAFYDRIALSVPTFTATGKEWIYSDYRPEDNVAVAIPTFSGYFGEVGYVTYSYYNDSITLSIPSFSGAMT